MPEASVDKQRDSLRWKHEIRFAEQLPTTPSALDAAGAE